MMEVDLRRRDFLRGASAAAVVGLVAPILSSPMACSRGDPLLAALGDFFDDRDAARIVGRIYLNQEPGERDARLLVERLAGPALEDWESLSRRDLPALRSALRARHREDLRTGNIVSLDGWQLSRTEARLYAVVAAR
jgi:hypothetical protein